jgi:CDGSH-type Zn-finger protein
MPHQIASDGGQHEEKVSQMVESITAHMNGNSPLSESGISSIQTILNPCGEHTSNSNKHFCDGTLSQAGVLKFRLFETIVPPFLNEATMPNSNNNWSLYGISPPCYKTVCIFVASSDASGLSDDTIKSIFSDFNDNALVLFPTWKRLTAISPYYYTVLQFPAADLKLDSKSKTSKEVESFRLVGDGMVVMHNTPDLWNQGSMAVGQYDTDYEVVDTEPTDIPITLTVQTGAYGTGTPTFNAYMTTGTGQVLWEPIKSGFQVAPLSAALLTRDEAEWSANTMAKATIVVQFDFALPLRTLTMTYVASGADAGLNFQCSGSPILPKFVLPITLAQNTTYTLNMVGRGPGILESGSVAAVTILKNPPMSQSSIVQLDPKYSAELMKQHMGFYAVRRYFEPVLNMTEVSVSGPIRFVTPGMDKSNVVVGTMGGIDNDVIDKNASSISFAIRGISWACLPTIKANRYIEMLPSPNSSLAPFVEDCPPKDDDAVEVFRQMQISGPHSFTPDANMLGFLCAMISTVVESLPVFLRGAKSISKGVTSALEWAEKTLYPV